MRRLLPPVLLLVLAGVAAVLARRSVVVRGAGTPTTWPAVPKNPAAPTSA